MLLASVLKRVKTFEEVLIQFLHALFQAQDSLKKMHFYIMKDINDYISTL